VQLVLPADAPAPRPAPAGVLADGTSLLSALEGDAPAL